MFNGKINYKWPFSIAMLVYQRVTLFELSIGAVMLLVIFEMMVDDDHSDHSSFF